MKLFLVGNTLMCPVCTRHMYHEYDPNKVLTPRFRCLTPDCTEYRYLFEVDIPTIEAREVIDERK